MKSKRQAQTVAMAVLVIDSGPIREKVKRDLARVRRQVEDARAVLEQFERSDRPAYERWYFRRFGAVLAELRNIQEQLSQKLQLLFEIRAEMIGGLSSARAYQRVMRRRDEGRPTESGEENGEKSQQDNRDSRGERSDHGWENSRRARTAAKAKRQAAADPKTAGRLKTLYRALARRLHPDSAGEMNAKQRESWLQVQQAYESGDLERLELLAGMLDLEQSEQIGMLTISGMLRLTQQFRRTLRRLRAQIARQRQDPAWEFSQRRDLQRVGKIVESELEDKLRELQLSLAELDKAVESRKGGRRRSSRDLF